MLIGRRGLVAVSGVAVLWGGLAVAAELPYSRQGVGVRAADTVPHILLDQTGLADAIARSAPPRKGEPLIVGEPLKVLITPRAGGLWEDVAGGTLWRITLQSPGAKWLVLAFGQFRLPPGAKLWVYDPRRDSGPGLLGPYERKDVREHGQLWVPPLAGDTATVELFWPASLKDVEPDLTLNLVSHGHRAIGPIGQDPTPKVGACEIDIMCPLGANWQDEKRGVVALLSGGSAYCTGSMIATTAQDCRPLVLTAAHCLSSTGSANSTDYLFNYEKPACNSGTAPTDQVVISSNLIATYSTSDFTLVELASPPPEAFNVYFNGWSRLTAPSTHSFCIHHPDGAEKKISEDTDSLVDGQSSGWGPTHWRVNQWEQAATEPGSSGSPLFDQNSRIVGQLHGGDSSCSRNTWDEYGKVDRSWTGGGSANNRMSDALDPGNTGAQFQDGFDQTNCLGPRADLKYVSNSTDDSLGNGDGYADPGEELLLPITISNTGNAAATSVSGQLQSNSVDVTLLDDTATWPDVAENGQQTSLAPHFRVRVADNAACGQALPLQLTNLATESPGSWTSLFSLTPGTPSITTLFEDTMEAGLGGWTSQQLQGTNSWSQTTQDSHSSSHSWFTPDVIRRSDTVLVMQTLNNLRANAELRFWHRYRTENFSDGGVLEYSADNGPWVDAAALITQGGYVAKIRANALSNLAGRDAWAGDSVGWGEVRVNLGVLAGKSVRLRWRFATDTSTGVAGWGVDDVTVRGTDFTCHPVVLKPGEASDPQSAGAPFSVTKDPGGYRLAWSSPASGGATSSYKLYRYTLPMAGGSAAQCEADLGTGTTAVLAALTANRGFVTVARNSVGDGSYGKASNGTERTPAVAACP